MLIMSNIIYFNKKDLEKLLEIINKFPEQQKDYKLEYKSSSGLGYCIDLILDHEVNGILGELKIPIHGVDQW